MKKTYSHPAALRQPMYPGAADGAYFAGKAVEILTALLTGAGTVTIMVFLVAMA